jgi:hypothetical protein
MRYNFVGAVIVSDEKCIAVVDIICGDIEKSD